MTAPSESSLRSSPTPKSRATPMPPATVSAPEVDPVEAVVADILTTPPEEIEIASVSLAEPIVPASLIMISSLNVTIPAEEICIASVAPTEPISPSLGTVILPVTVRVVPSNNRLASPTPELEPVAVITLLFPSLLSDNPEDWFTNDRLPAPSVPRT